MIRTFSRFLFVLVLFLFVFVFAVVGVFCCFTKL